MSKINTVRVWDPFIRFFHWSLVVAFALAYVSEDESLNLHVLAGYYISGLLLLRIIWGFIGTRHARFADFVYRPAKVKAYLQQLLRLKARPYVGHNPAGGAMVLALLLSLVLTALSGMAIYGAEEQAGPLAVWAADWNGHWLEELHEFFANLTLGLVLVHISAVILSSLLLGENLIRAMWTGKKSLEEEQ